MQSYSISSMLLSVNQHNMYSDRVEMLPCTGRHFRPWKASTCSPLNRSTTWPDHHHESRSSQITQHSMRSAVSAYRHSAAPGVSSSSRGSSCVTGFHFREEERCSQRPSLLKSHFTVQYCNIVLVPYSDTAARI